MVLQFGDVGDIYLPTERETGRSRGFAFVRFYDKRDAEVRVAGVETAGTALLLQLAAEPPAVSFYHLTSDGTGVKDFLSQSHSFGSPSPCCNS